MHKKYLGIGLFVAIIGIGVAIIAPDTCRGDIYCLEQTDPWLKERLDRTVPLFIVRRSGKHFKEVPKEVWRKLYHNAGAFGHFHGFHKKAGPISCAVVANGGTLSGSGYGRKIDGYTYVFRMNGAPMEGYEKDVGTKTTISVLVSDPGFVIRDFGEQSFAVVWGGNVFESLTPQLLGEKKEKPTRLIMESPATPVMVFHPSFNRYIGKNWFTPDATLTNEEWPSTGFRTIILAMHLCNTVDLFGFGPNARGEWRHYYNERGVISRHRPDYQEEFINTLVRRGIVTRHMGNMD